MKRSPKGHWDAKVRFGKGRNKHLHIPADFSEPEAEARLVQLRKLADIVGVLDTGEALVLLQQAASASSAELPDLFALGREMAARATKAPVRLSGYRFRDVCDLWTSGELARRWPDFVKEKEPQGAETDKSMLAVLCKTIGDIPIVTFTLDDADRAIAELSPKLRANTRRHYRQALRRVLKLAAYPCKFIPVSPIPAGWVPPLAEPRAMSFLYPREDAQLVTCADVPFARRRAYGVLAREGCRLSELLRCQRRHIDLDYGFMRLDKNKTDDARTWEMREDVVRTLRIVCADMGLDDHVFEPLGSGGDEAEVFRADLTRAGITRPELFEDNEDRQNIRLHDLRATFITLALANGKSEAWIRDRTGHTTSAMLVKYARPSRLVGKMGELGPLDELLGLRQKSRQKVSAKSKRTNSSLILVPSQGAWR